MENLITPKVKDEILSFLVANNDLNVTCNSSLPEALLKLVGNKNNLQAILAQFCRLGLLSRGIVNSHSISVCVNIEAHDFLGRGGFVVHEEILKSNISKLEFELKVLSKELEPKFAEKASVISALCANIATVFGLFRW